MENFKTGDATELKYQAAFNAALSNQSGELTSLFNGEYSCEKLGDVIYNEDISIMTGTIPIELFRQCFSEIFNEWRYPGTFRSYISVFQKVFGGNTEIIFSVPCANCLHITISTTNVINYYAIARVIAESVVTNYKILLNETDYLVFQKQIISDENKLIGILNSLRPTSIYTTFEINLV